MICLSGPRAAQLSPLPKSPMIRLGRACDAWGTAAFAQVLKEEIERLGPACLPLQQGLRTGSQALDRDIRAMILSVAETDACIRVRAGLFYLSVIAGCSCADDPTPIDECNEYCEVQLEIDKATAETTITLLPE